MTRHGAANLETLEVEQIASGAELAAQIEGHASSRVSRANQRDRTGAREHTDAGEGALLRNLLREPSIPIAKAAGISLF